MYINPVSQHGRVRKWCINILKSIDEGIHFRWGLTRVIVAKGTEGSLNLGPERPRVYSNLSQDEKDRWLLGRIGINKEDREHKLYDTLNTFRQNKGETIHRLLCLPSDVDEATSAHNYVPGSKLSLPQIQWCDEAGVEEFEQGEWKTCRVCDSGMLLALQTCMASYVLTGSVWRALKGRSQDIVKMKEL
ncbi:hypothetical protein Tco_0115285 [Tanacetum coccineum]